MKLHLGCGKVSIPGYVNIDIQHNPGTDLIADVRQLPFRPNSIDFIYSCSVIEHFGRKKWKEVIKHWYSLLKVGGKLRLSTADFEAVCIEYAEKKNIGSLFGLVVGGQKDRHDWHGMIFDFTFLKAQLEEVGFRNIRRYDWRQTELFDLGIDDYSQAYLPHMDKEHGRLMMLNIEAEK